MKILYAKQIGKLLSVPVLVDDDIYETAKNRKWYIDKVGYPFSPKTKDSTLKNIRIHKLVLGSKDGFEIDHINQDKLDNRRCNLRFLTHQENCTNRKLGRPVFDKHRNKWRAKIKVKQKFIHLGRFETYIEAAEVLQVAQNKYFGLNSNL